MRQNVNRIIFLLFLRVTSYHPDYVTPFTGVNSAHLTLKFRKHKCFPGLGILVLFDMILMSAFTSLRRVSILGRHFVGVQQTSNRLRALSRMAVNEDGKPTAGIISEYLLCFGGGRNLWGGWKYQVRNCGCLCLLKLS